MENTIEAIKNSIETIKNYCDMTDVLEAKLNFEANTETILDILEYIVNKLESEI